MFKVVLGFSTHVFQENIVEDRQMCVCCGVGSGVKSLPCRRISTDKGEVMRVSCVVRNVGCRL